MTARVLVLHAYSAENAGDGLLVQETLEVLKDALGDTDVTMVALRPETFPIRDVEVLPAVPGIRGLDPRTRQALRKTDEFSLIIGVGGGYLRAGTLLETIKSAIVHLPQLAAAARSATPSVYLPQSVGPARLGLAGPLNNLLRRVDRVMLRDDRSMAEFGGPESLRVPDMATVSASRGRRPDPGVDSTPIVSLRAVHGKVPPRVLELAARLDTYDSYIQSTTGGNDDRPATALLQPRSEVSRQELLDSDNVPRVVVAVRLHAALMALAAGHYVIHLAYERKGFGAFQDLGIAGWVHSVNRFDVGAVADQTDALLRDQSTRDAYEAGIASARSSLESARQNIVSEIQRLAKAGTRR